MSAVRCTASVTAATTSATPSVGAPPINRKMDWLAIPLASGRCMVRLLLLTAGAGIAPVRRVLSATLWSFWEFRARNGAKPRLIAEFAKEVNNRGGQHAQRAL